MLRDPSAVPRVFALLCVLSGVLAFVLLGAPGAAFADDVESADDAPAAEEPIERDPILQDIIDMLEAKLSEDLIREWLTAYGKKPGVPTAADLVALRDAGASDQLMSYVLESGRRPEPPAAPSAPAAPAAPTAQAPAAPVARDTAPAPAAGETEAGAAADETVLVSFRLAYSPNVPDGEPEWDLYVYLDGKPLSYVAPRGLLGGDRLEFQKRLAPGRHVLRVTREQHQERRDRWRHRARVAGDDIAFTLRPGAAATFELSFGQSLLSFDDPLSYRFVQGDTVDVREDFGGNPDRWAEICEEVETELEGEPSRGERRRLADCRRWSDLWPGLDVPPRAEVREAMARFGYRPVPKTESLF
ncbi:MAG: hypothetical protein AAGC60_08105 [Acidobacteriota bacterium]